MRIILISFLLLAFFSCSKEPEEQAKSVTLSCYSTSPKFYLAYFSDEWQKDTIYTSTYSVTYNINETDLGYIIQMNKTVTNVTDSIHIEALFEGRKIEKGYKGNLGNNINLSIQLN